MTPALALMKKRNNDIKSVLYRTFAPRERPRSYTFAVSRNWKKSHTEKEGAQERRIEDENT